MQANPQNMLAIKNPQLASEWHPTKNENLTPNDVGIGSKKKVWWLGKCGHEWEDTPLHRNRGIGCPYCSNRRILTESTKFPRLYRRWDVSANDFV